LLAQHPAPVRLTPSPAKWLLYAAISATVGGWVLSIVLTEDGLSLGAIGGWLVVACLALNLAICIGHLLPGVAYLRLDADGFESKTLFGRRVGFWKTASNFRAEGGNVSRRVAFDVYTNEPPRSALFNYLIRRQRTLADNYGMAHEDLARLMTQWRAKALGVSAQ
jgi:hypothetical protein